MEKVIKYVVILIYALFSSAGVILMNKGGNAGTLSMQEQNITFGVNKISLLGLICYIISFLMYTQIVTKYNVSYIVPILTGVVQVLTLIAAIVILKEPVNIISIIGAILIIVGIVVMNIKV